MIPMKLRDRHHSSFSLVFCLLPVLISAAVQSRQSPASVPVFTRSFNSGGKKYDYTVAGGNPALGGTTVIPTVIVPVALVFDGFPGKAGTSLTLDAISEVPKVVRSPIFQDYSFATGRTQYGDAVQRAEFYKELRTDLRPWHTILGQPRVLPALQVHVPVGDGYVLTSRRTGLSLAVVDLEFARKELFKGLLKTGSNPRELVIALTKNTMFYPLNDATVCCSWGAYGAQFSASSNSAQSFILGTYLDPGVVPRFSDIQTLSEQVAQWMNDPLQGYRSNSFPPWRMPGEKGGCGGRGEGSFYRFAEPADSGSVQNATPVTLNGAVYHLENAALLPWFAGNGHPATFKGAYSFPGIHALAGPAQPCFDFRGRRPGSFTPSARPVAETNPPNGHELIGYWAGYSRLKAFPLRNVSPQWDVVIVAFASPAKGSKSLMVFHTPAGYTDAQFKSGIAFLQSKGKKVLISLGGGGRVVTLNTADDVRDFVTSVSAIVQKYNFNGVDLDFETPSLILDPGDTDFRHPTTPSVVNLIAAMHQLRRQLGPGFMIAEVPEGPQVPAGFTVYGGQFGSFLPVIYGTRKILSFVDVQNYNTPPLEGLDGNYYMPGTADYYVSMTEMLLRGFTVGRDPKSFFPPLPPGKVAIGFLVGRSSVPSVEDALRYLIEGNPYPAGEYRLRQSGGYPDFNGAMYWNIQADRRGNYRMSNAIGPFLHALPPPPLTSGPSASGRR